MRPQDGTRENERPGLSTGGRDESSHTPGKNMCVKFLRQHFPIQRSNARLQDISHPQRNSSEIFHSEVRGDGIQDARLFCDGHSPKQIIHYSSSARLCGGSSGANDDTNKLAANDWAAVFIYTVFIIASCETWLKERRS